MSAAPPPDPTDPQAILDLIDDAHAELQAALAGLSDAQKTEPDATGRWRVQDVLAHLARWNVVAREVVEYSLRGERHPTSFRDFLAWNDRWEEEDKGLPLAEAEQRFERSHAELVALLRSLRPEQWERRVMGWAKAAVWEHYPEHTAWLREWRARRGI